MIWTKCLSKIVLLIYEYIHYTIYMNIEISQIWWDIGQISRKMGQINFILHKRFQDGGMAVLTPPWLKLGGGVPPWILTFLSPGRMAMHPKRLASILANSVLNAWLKRLKKIGRRRKDNFFYFYFEQKFLYLLLAFL